jgi:acyl-CoA thioesterase-2
MKTRQLLDALVLEPVGAGLFRAGHADAAHGVVSGGQLLGQTLVAAAAGHDGKSAKTIHTVFARAGSSDAPLDIRVDSISAGRTFASSSVVISQGGRICAQSVVLLTADEPDLIRHADTAGVAAPPSERLADGQWQVSIVDGVDISDPDAVGPPDLDVWVRCDGAPADLLLNQALIAYSTDFFLIGTAMRPHAGVGQAQAHKTLSTGVISHTLTFHEQAPADEWTLLRHHSTYVGRGRSYGQANVFRRDGVLAASFVQDAMIRPMGDWAPRL